MEDLIKRSAAIKAEADRVYKALHSEGCKETYEECLADAEKTFKDVPSAEPKRGRWVRCKSERMILGYECSQCGEICRKIEYNPDCDFHSPGWNFCPNCGARMNAR